MVLHDYVDSKCCGLALKLSKAVVKRGLAGLIFDLKADSLVGDWW
jgi:hypothetical protein